MRIRDKGWKKFGTRDTYPGSATLVPMSDNNKQVGSQANICKSSYSLFITKQNKSLQNNTI